MVLNRSGGSKHNTTYAMAWRRDRSNGGCSSRCGTSLYTALECCQGLFEDHQHVLLFGSRISIKKINLYTVWFTTWCLILKEHVCGAILCQNCDVNVSLILNRNGYFFLQYRSVKKNKNKWATTYVKFSLLHFQGLFKATTLAPAVKTLRCNAPYVHRVFQVMWS
jgi:hypothetical protein